MGLADISSVSGLERDGTQDTFSEAHEILLREDKASAEVVVRVSA